MKCPDCNAEMIKYTNVIDGVYDEEVYTCWKCLECKLEIEDDYFNEHLF